MADMYPTISPTVPLNSMYPDAIKDPIDLRDQLNIILFGGEGESAKGHWIVYRRMDLTQHSEYWNSETREAVGGPPWEYEDTIVRTRSVIGRAAGLMSDMEQYSDVGIINTTYSTYYFEYDLNPKKEDEIYEMVDEMDVVRSTKPILIDLPYKIRYVIRDAIPYRCDDGGRIEYWACICRRDVVE